MTILTYDHYEGSAVPEDGRIVIQILHVDDFVTTECKLASEAQGAFEQLVRDYVETCASIGKSPQRSMAIGASGR